MSTPMQVDEAEASNTTPWRNVRVFSPPNVAGPSRIPPIPDDDPKPTPAELKMAFASHIEQRHGPDAPLMTQAMRERHEARLGLRKKEYNETRIRIRFSDRTQLEASLPSTAQVPVLYGLLRAHLSSQHASTAFTLYQAPPKRDFPEHTADAKLRGKTLKELGMVPQASLNIRWSDADINSDTFPAPLADEYKANAQALPSPPLFEGPTTAVAADEDDGESSKRKASEQKKVSIAAAAPLATPQCALADTADPTDAKVAQRLAE